MSATFLSIYNELPGIEKCQHDDVEGFRLLYHLFNHELQAEAASMLLVPGKAAIVVKHSFISCWIQRKQFDSIDYALGFLLSAINKHCIDCNNGSLTEQQEQVIHSLLSDAVWESKDHLALLTYINCLPAGEYEQAINVFASYYRRQLPIAAIAQQMHLEPAMVQNKLNLAFTILHFILTGEHI